SQITSTSFQLWTRMARAQVRVSSLSVDRSSGLPPYPPTAWHVGMVHLGQGSVRLRASTCTRSPALRLVERVRCTSALRPQARIPGHTSAMVQPSLHLRPPPF